MRLGRRSECIQPSTDVIIRMDEKDIADIRDLPRIVAETPADKRVNVAVIRDDAEEALFQSHHRADRKANNLSVCTLT